MMPVIPVVDRNSTPEFVKGRRKTIHAGKAFAEQPVASLGTAEIFSAKVTYIFCSPIHFIGSRQVVT
jgi:hypothetical protein